MGSLAVVCGEVSVSSEKRRFVLGVDFGPRESILSILLRIRLSALGAENGGNKEMTEYRKVKGSDTWHWCTNCSNWPTSNYDVWTGTGRPPSGELDNECRGKERNNECN